MTQVLELKAGDSLGDAIHLLYEKNVSVALIKDSSSNNFSTNNAATSKFLDQYIGVISFASMVLWCIQVLIYTTRKFFFKKKLFLMENIDITYHLWFVS